MLCLNPLIFPLPPPGSPPVPPPPPPGRCRQLPLAAPAARHRFSGTATPAPSTEPLKVGSTLTLKKIVREAFDRGFSDVHLGVGEAPRFRDRGRRSGLTDWTRPPTRQPFTAG
jgi:twitching motility protein PilT